MEKGRKTGIMGSGSCIETICLISLRSKLSGPMVYVSEGRGSVRWENCVINISRDS